VPAVIWASSASAQIGPAPAAPPDAAATSAQASGSVESAPEAAAQAAVAESGAAAQTPESARLLALEQRISELEAERNSEQEAALELETEQQKLRIYGFLDFGLRKTWPAKDPFFKGLVARELTFVIGNINIYLDAQPTPDWRALIETRLTTYPHGQENVTPAGEFVRTDTRIYDTTSPSGRNKVIWGGIVLERAQIEHTMTDLFNLRVGYFLTPYGIWNVDHGTPTLISLVLPAFQVEESVPARQLGVQAYGAMTTGNIELGYAAYVSNGRAPFLEDPTDTKAVGGRVHANWLGDNLRLKLGASGYVGDSLDRSKRLTFSEDGVGLSVDTTYDYEEWAFGADLALDWGDFRTRVEGLVHRVRYEDGRHEPLAYGAPGRFQPNRYEYFGYSIFAYRLGAFEPYTYTELKYTNPSEGSFDMSYLPGFGVNVHFSPYAQLKTQYLAAKFYDLGADGGDAVNRNFRLIDSRFVLSF
jgi:hypothetical protein